MQPPAWSMRYTLCGRRSHSSPASGEGHRRLKNWPGLTASAFGDAATTRCLYSSLTQSCAITGHRASSAGISASTGEGSLLPTMNGADAKTSPIALDLAFYLCRMLREVNYTPAAAKSRIYAIWGSHRVSVPCRVFDEVDPVGVIARLDRAIHGWWLLGRRSSRAMTAS